jgi:glycosyltransferase involved in cell wall biosynthesis
MKKKIHILVIGANYYGTMATAQRLRNLLNPRLDKNGIFASNLLFNSKETPANNKLQKVHFVNVKYSKKNPFDFIAYHCQAFKYINQQKRQDSDNILFCYGYPMITNILILKYAKRKGYKIVFNIEEKNLFGKSVKKNVLTVLRQQSVTYLLKQIPALGSLCFAISSRLIEYCNSICKGKIPVVELPISVDIDFVQSFKKNVKKGKIQIFYGGSFGEKDGIPFLIEGFSQACKKVSNLELVLTGKIATGLENQVFELINASEEKDKIKYLGCLPTEKYYEVMANADILCMLRVSSEFANAGFPFKLGEYLASSNAVIATRVSDIEYYLKHKENAYLINPDSSEEIGEGLLGLVANINLRNEIGSSGHKTARTYFECHFVSNILFKGLMGLYK